MSIQIDNGNSIILDGETTLFMVAQHDDKTSVWSIGNPVTMPHKRYSLTTSFGLEPGVAGLDQFEADIRMLVERFVSNEPKKLTTCPWADMADASDEASGVIRIKTPTGWVNATEADISAMLAAPELINVLKELMQQSHPPVGIDTEYLLGKHNKAMAAAIEITIRLTGLTQ